MANYTRLPLNVETEKRHTKSGTLCVQKLTIKAHFFCLLRHGYPFWKTHQ